MFRFHTADRIRLFQHTAARRRLVPFKINNLTFFFSFNTQPPEGGWAVSTLNGVLYKVSTHSRPKAAGVTQSFMVYTQAMFQHTAARRRLDKYEHR